MMKTSEAIGEISAAFVKAQMGCESAKKSNDNNAFRNNGKASKYAGLPEVVEACLPACHANGIGVLQVLGETIDGKMGITTRLLHTSGQWLEGYGSIPLPKQDPQGYGSASTYARRYHLAAMLGIIQEDDDGNAAEAAPKANPAPMIDQTQRGIITDLAKAADVNILTILESYSVKNLDALTEAQAAQIIKRLNSRIDQKNIDNAQKEAA